MDALSAKLNKSPGVVDKKVLSFLKRKTVTWLLRQKASHLSQNISPFGDETGNTQSASKTQKRYHIITKLNA